MNKESTQSVKVKITQTQHNHIILFNLYIIIMESIEYKVHKNGERITSEIIISSSDMTHKQAEKIIESFSDIGFDTSITRENNRVCVVIKVLDVFNIMR